MRLLTATWFAAHAVDVAFTVWGIGIMGVMREINPIGYGRSWLAWPVKVGCVLLAPFICRAMGPPKTGRLFLAFGTAFYVLLAAWNAGNIVAWVLITRGLLNIR